MRAWQISSFGLDGLELVERPDPVPGPGQALVELSACSLNYRDLLMVEGHYNPRQPLPLIPLSDGVGRVASVGEGVSRVADGDRVAGIFAQGWLDGAFSAAARATTLGGPLDGMLAERMVLDAEGLVRVPKHLSDEEAACLPCAALTAHNALVEQGRVGPGQVVVLLGTGGVSLSGLQLAKAAGARVIITSSSDEKLERARSLGADETINYRQEERWDKRVLELTDGQGADLVVEVGGAGTFARSLAAVRIAGQVALIGILSGVEARVPLTSILMKHVRVQGILVGSRAMFERMNETIAAKRIRPVVDRVFNFGQAPEAFAHLKSGAHFGKIVVRVR